MAPSLAEPRWRMDAGAAAGCAPAKVAFRLEAQGSGSACTLVKTGSSSSLPTTAEECWCPASADLESRGPTANNTADAADRCVPAAATIAAAPNVQPTPGTAASAGANSTLIEDLELHEQIGCGGFGAVYRATLRSNGRDVAVKVLNVEALRQRYATSEATLMREVAVMEQIDHPGAIRLLGWSLQGTQLSLAMDLCVGPDLQQLLEVRGALHEAEAAVITRQLAEALSHMHSLGIVHRDVKPANVMFVERMSKLAKTPLRGRQVKLIDMGCAKLLCHSQQYTQRRRRGRSHSVLSERTESALRSLANAGRGSRRSKRQASASADGSSSKFHPQMSAGSSRKPEASHSTSLSRKGGSASGSPEGSAWTDEQDWLEELTMVGTAIYAPPEVLRPPAGRPQKVVLTFKSSHLIDSYGLGRTLRFMLTGVPPHQSVFEALDARGMLCFAALDLFCGRREPRIVEPQELTRAARDLMNALSAPDPAKRMHMQDALRHAWLAVEL